MARHRDFEAAVAEQQHDPITFSLLGHTFTCLPEAPGGMLLDIMAMADASLPDLLAFFRSVIVDEQVDEFLTLIHSKDTVVNIKTLGAIATWLIEEYAGGRPTEPSVSSENGRQPTGPSSTEHAPAPA